MNEKKENIVQKKSFEFACDILDLYQRLIDLKMYRIADQVCGSGTSVGANVSEAQRAVSKADFINKLGIALKEAEETSYWFALIERKIFKIDTKLKEELHSLIKILTAIIISSKQNKH